MLRTFGDWSFRASELAIHQRAVRSSNFILARTQSAGLSAREIGGSQKPSARWWLWCVVSGELYVHTAGGGQIIRSGEVFGGPASDCRLGSSSPSADFVTLYYDPAFSGVAPAAPGGPAALSREDRRLTARALTSLMDGEASGTRAAREWAAWGDALGIPGWGRQTVAASKGPTAQETHTAALVSRLSSNLLSFPSVEDFSDALDLPPRRTSERLGTHFRRYHASFTGWRSYLNTLRTELAWSMLSDGIVPAHRAAEWLGYRHTTSMYHALYRRGWRARG